RARRICRRASEGRFAARGLPAPIADAACRRCHARIERARFDADRRKSCGRARRARLTPLPMPTYSVVALTDLATRALARAGANAAMASITADALVDGELQGLASHGVSRIPQYATHLRNGRADGNAIPAIIRERGGAVLVDARNGLAFPACAMAVQEAIRRATELGVSFAGVTRSHHFGVAADHLQPVSAAGLVGLAFGNSPAAMAAAGGRHPVFGTNPIAAT